MHFLARSFLLAAPLLTACADGEEETSSNPVVVPARCLSVPTTLPPTLSMMGLFADDGLSALCPAVRPFTPAATLWSDGADKSRFVRFPEGAVVDATDVDHWSFPRGTLFWKEFRIEGVRVETRAMIKVGDGDGEWEMSSYRWRAAGDDADLVPDGAENVTAAGWDIPSTAACLTCHENERSGVLGYGAVMLSHDDQLQELVDDSLLAPVPASLKPAVHSWPEPARSALLYLSVNCGHCHQAGGAGTEGTALDDVAGLALRVKFADPDQHNTGASTTSSLPLASPLDEATERVVAGDPLRSGLYLRLTHRDWTQMPPLGTEIVDDEGAAKVWAWIVSLDR
ncbi:MAG: hypothetical protein Q8O67_05470 [Deltaproteobacteria bacterium]|nr:hypothetical protein [Deltaproteobacteria bacterium]